MILNGYSGGGNITQIVLMGDKKVLLSTLINVELADWANNSRYVWLERFWENISSSSIYSTMTTHGHWRPNVAHMSMATQLPSPDLSSAHLIAN